MEILEKLGQGFNERKRIVLLGIRILRKILEGQGLVGDTAWNVKKLKVEKLKKTRVVEFKGNEIPPGWIEDRPGFIRKI